MPATRASRDQEGPQTRGGQKKGGRPPLPTNNNKKQKQKSTKSKDVVAAKRSIANEEANKALPVKVKQETVSKRRMWTDEEDLALCKAYVNITTDPCVGSKQKGDAFWMRVQKKMYEFYEEDAEVQTEAKDEWAYKSLESRFKVIGKAVQAFNGYYRAVTKDEESGWTEQMHIEAASQLFFTTEGKAFKFPICARVLHGCPKFKPTNEPIVVDEEDEEGAKKPAANPIASIQGKGLPIPKGTKAAAKAKRSITDADSLATTQAHTDAVLSVAKAAEHLNASYNKRRKTDSMHKTVDAYIRLGMVEKAQEILAQIEAIDKEDEKQETEPEPQDEVPGSINIDELNEELGLVGPGTFRFRSVVDDALDDGDNGSSSDEEPPVPPKQATESTLSEEEEEDLSQQSSTEEGRAKILARNAKNHTGVQ